MRAQTTQCEALFKNHQATLLRYDAFIQGQASLTDELTDDFHTMRKESIGLERYERELGTLEKNLREALAL
jgi:hypothetical protein